MSSLCTRLHTNYGATKIYASSRIAYPPLPTQSILPHNVLCINTLMSCLKYTAENNVNNDKEEIMQKRALINTAYLTSKFCYQLQKCRKNWD